MGKSKSIKEQLEKNSEFKDYVQKISGDMDERQNALAQELESMKEEHYKNYPDNALLIEGKYSHLTTISEWSLQSISAIIDDCSKAIFGEKKDTPDGSTKKDTDAEVSASIQAAIQQQEYIANAAFDIVQSIVSSFSDSTSTSVEKKVDGKPIAPGMTLFIGVENNSFSAQSFFSGEKIEQIIFVFKVFYSIKEGQAQSALSDLQMYEDQKTVFRKKIESIDKLIEALDVSDADYAEKLTKYTDSVELTNDRLDLITQKIKKLSDDKLQAERVACNQIVDRVRARKNSLRGVAANNT